MLTKNHAKLVEQVKIHIDADAVLQKTYWDEEEQKGCFIGCLAHSSDASFLQSEYGLPLPLVRICENIFERLPLDQAKQFFADIPAAVGADGKDLSLVHWKFLHQTLKNMPITDDKTQSAIDVVIEGVGLLADGKEWPARAARAAARAADAAYAVAYIDRAARAADAAYAAYAVAYIDHAARAADAVAYIARAARAARAAAYAAAAADAAARAAAHAYAAAARAAYDAAAAAHAYAAAYQRDILLKIITDAPMGDFK
jgi:hypothetical protein